MLIVPKDCGLAYYTYFYGGSSNPKPSTVTIYEFDFNRWPWPTVEQINTYAVKIN